MTCEIELLCGARVEAGARALCEYGVITVDGEVATWERHHRKLVQMAQIVLNAVQDCKSDLRRPIGVRARVDGRTIILAPEDFDVVYEGRPTMLSTGSSGASV